MLSICFSMIKGERDVTAYSSIDLITRNVQSHHCLQTQNEVIVQCRRPIRFEALFFYMCWLP